MKSFVGEKRRKFHQMSMALVTVQRSPSVTGSPPQCGSEGEAEDDDGTKTEKSECFFACKDTALGLTLKDVPTKKSERRPSTDSVKSTNSTQSNNSDIQQHLQSMIDLLNPEETLKMAVKLESQRPNRTRYLVIVSRCCYRSTTTERKGKIIRHNSTKTRNVTATTNIATMRQLSTDSIQRTPQQQRQQQQQSQTESSSGGEESADGQERHTSSVSPSSQCQSLKSDSEKISASGDSKACEDGVEESCLLGIDCNERTTIGLVLPILADTTIHLDGDGGFSVSVYGKTHIFKPVSVQAMWSALQTLHKVSQKARENNFYPRGPSHDWTTFYDSHIESEQSCLNEWNAMDSLESRRPPSPDAIRNKPTAKEETESVIKMKLKEIMMSVDLDEVTSKYIRGRLEELLDMDLGEFKSFIDAEMLTILGQMDAPTEIFDHVYLGSEWNASNLEELQKNGIRHILNVTREIDNFFPGVFDYFNVRVYDDEKTNLLKYWDNTFRYITRAKSEGSKVLVHCKMGVSRSASVVIAYAMKAYNWEFKHALQHVKQRRSCIKPNKNFLNQLETYRGMLDAMKNKEKLQRSKSETNLKSTKDARLLPGSEPTPLIQALNQSKSKSGRGRDDTSCGDNIINIVCNDGTDVNIKCLGRSKASMADGNGNDGSDGGIGVVSVISGVGATENKHRRLVRRSSSTSPQAVPHVPPHMTVVIKQQSQSLENLTPERSVAEEPKNMRFPGSNGENYSVTQNQVRHIQKNVQPPPPPPPPPPATKSTQQQRQHQQQQHRQQQREVYQQQNKQRQQIASVRTRVLDLETTHTTTITTRKTADDRRSLNLQFGRSVSHDTGTTAQRGEPIIGGDGYGGDGGTLQNEHSPVWTSSAKLITQTSNLKSAGEGIATRISDEILPNQRHSGSSDISSSVSLDASTTTITSDRCKEEHEVQQKQQVPMDARRHSRKTHSWTAATTSMNMQSNMNEFRSGGIVLDRLNVLGIGSGGTSVSSSSGTSGKFGSNSSIDSISTCAAAASSTPPSTTINVNEEREQRATAVITRTHRQRDLPSRHASWGSGDTRSAMPVRNSSWAAYDSNRNSCHYGGGGGGGGAILEGQIHEPNINKSNKTVTPPQLYQNIPRVSPTQFQPQHQHHIGTVKRTKQKLEQCGGGGSTHVLKKICPENGADRTAIATTTTTDEASTLMTTNCVKRGGVKGATNLFRSASAAGSTRIRCSPYRCNSVEIVPAAAGTVSAISCGSSNSNTTDPADMVMRRSEGSRPLHNELFNASSSAPESYTISDIENKNTLPLPQSVTMRTSTTTTPPPASLVAGLDEDEQGEAEEDQVVLRGGCSTNITTDQRISGSVQILKKNFEAKAGSSSSVSSTNTNVLQVQNVAVPTTKKKGHHSLPSSPVAQHVDPHHHHQQQQQQQEQHHHHTDNNPNSQRNSTASSSTVYSKASATIAVCDVDELTAEMMIDTNTLTHVDSAAAAAAPDTENTNENMPQTTTTPAFISSRQTSSSSSSASSSSASSSSSTSSASSGMCEPYIDRNVKVLVNKYQTTPTPASAIISSSGNEISVTAPAVTATVVSSTTASPVKPRRHSYYDSGGHVSHRTTYTGGSGGVGVVGSSSSKVGKHIGVSSGHLSHEYNESRPPPAPVKSTLTTHPSAVQAREAVGDNTQQPQQQQNQQQHQQRRLQQHGRTHPLSRLTLPKQSFNTAAYNTM